MTTNPNLRKMRGGQRTSATRIMAEAKAEMEKDGGDMVTLGVLHSKLTEKLSKIQLLDEQILEAMTENEDFEQEALTQDEKTVEIEQVIGNLVAMLRGGMTLWGSMTEKVTIM